jgi:hypothetical protein
LPWFRFSKQVLDLYFFAPDSGGLIPVYFSDLDRAIGQSDAGYAFSFTPSAAPIDASQPGDLADSRPGGESLDLRNFAQKLEVLRSITGSAIG